MWIDDLRQHGFVLRDGEWIADHVAVSIAQPCGRFVALEHEHAAFTSRRPEGLFFYSRVDLKNGSKRVLVLAGKARRKLVSVLVVLEIEDHASGSAPCRWRIGVSAGSKDAGCTAFADNGAGELAFGCMGEKNKSVVQVRLTAAVRAGENVDGLER